ncbi:hypothetical protein FRC10_007445 [Ceratobasidium sp. 414]|nr:hypothetical protein FRC10_007445 [Ceratobasidium sp. 414]
MQLAKDGRTSYISIICSGVLTNNLDKFRAGAESGAATPLQRSGSTNGAEDQGAGTPNAKPKASKKKKKADAPESTNGNNKRESAAPAKPSKAKKQKVGKAANGKPLAFQPADLEGSATYPYLMAMKPSIPSPSQAKMSSVTRIPSKLQNSQTPISPAGSSSTTPTHTPQLPPAPAPPRIVRGTGPPRPLLGRGPSIPRTTGVVIDKAPPPPPTRQSSASHSRTEADGDIDDLVDTASDSSDDS